ncbi:kirola-like [Bidens hawaiensis]|uniref:kirola-like n=1 Tax=Bidens hawaiensis TaxID=980011 RepID=UPI0040495022
MALSGKFIGYVNISKNGDVFHDLLRHKHSEMVALVPDKIHDCELHEGERDAVGSVMNWHFTKEGKKETSKQIIESVNEENHTIVLKIIGGELVDGKYKYFTMTFHVEPKGDGQVAIWTFEYEKLDTSVPYPTADMDFVCNLIKHLDAHKDAK